MKICLYAYAKINLFLDVVGRLENGYHDILSLMQSVSLYDTVEISVSDAESDAITLLCDCDGIPTDGRNLAVRAANAFYREVGFFRKTEIRIQKRIPVSAGLAGGSTDAAAVLVGLNRLFGKPLDTDALCAVGKTLGADIPFCILSGTAEVTGIGDRLKPLSDIPALPMVVAKRGEGVSTPIAYGKLDHRYGNFADRYKGGTAPHGKYGALLRALSDGNAAATATHLYNVFESVVEEDHPEVLRLKRFFLENGAIAAMMSGSGPSVFAIFPSDASAEWAAKRLNDESGEKIAFYVHPINRDTASVCAEEAL